MNYTRINMMVKVDPFNNAKGAGIYEDVYYGLGVWVSQEGYIQTGGAGGFVYVSFIIRTSNLRRVLKNLADWPDTDVSHVTTHELETADV